MAWTTPFTSTVGMVLTAALMNQSRDNFNYLKGTRTSYTPQVDQGASTNIGKTVNHASYVQAGDVCHVWMRLAITASGTGGSAVSVTVPITSAVSGIPIGACMVFNTSASTDDTGVAYLNSTTQIIFQIDDQSGGWGATPNEAIANGDVLYVAATYPVV